MKRMLIPALFAGGLCLETAAAVRTIYLEEFDHFADTVHCFNTGTSCAEWTTGGLKGLLFRPEEEGAFARDGFFPITEPPQGEWTFSFLAWNRAKEPSAFSMVLYYGDRKNPQAVDYPFTVTNNFWRTCAVFSDGRGPLVGWNVKGAAGAQVFFARARKVSSEP